MKEIDTVANVPSEMRRIKNEGKKKVNNHLNEKNEIIFVTILSTKTYTQLYCNKKSEFAQIRWHMQTLLFNF